MQRNQRHVIRLLCGEKVRQPKGEQSSRRAVLPPSAANRSEMEVRQRAAIQKRQQLAHDSIADGRCVGDCLAWLMMSAKYVNRPEEHGGGHGLEQPIGFCKALAGVVDPRRRRPAEWAAVRPAQQPIAVKPKECAHDVQLKVKQPWEQDHPVKAVCERGGRGAHSPQQQVQLPVDNERRNRSQTPITRSKSRANRLEDLVAIFPRHGAVVARREHVKLRGAVVVVVVAAATAAAPAATTTTVIAAVFSVTPRSITEPSTRFQRRCTGSERLVAHGRAVARTHVGVARLREWCRQHPNSHQPPRVLRRQRHHSTHHKVQHAQLATTALAPHPRRHVEVVDDGYVPAVGERRARGSMRAQSARPRSASPPRRPTPAAASTAALARRKSTVATTRARRRAASSCGGAPW